MVDNIALFPQDHLYVGVEAFDNLELLPRLIEHCKSCGVHLHLLTFGQMFAGFDEAVKCLAQLQEKGPFSVISVSDAAHWALAERERFRVWLRAVRSTRIQPEVLFLKNISERLPRDLLALPEINKYGFIYCREATGIFDYFRRKNWTYVEARSPDQKQPVPFKALAPERTRPHQFPFPMMFNTLVLETTHLCNARCSHCYTSCGPESSPSRLSVDKMKQVVTEAAALPNLAKRCHLGGGEATIYWNETIEIFRHAKQCGFSNSIVTNGWWAKSADLAARRVLDLKQAGVAVIELSVDAMHQQFLSSERISHLIRAAKEHGIRVTFRVCTTKRNGVDSVLEQFDGEDQNGLTIAISAVSPIGRAKTDIPADDLYLEEGIPLGSCSSFLNLTVTPNGDIFPCCAGSEICPSLKIGNVVDQTLAEAMGALNGNTFLRTLVHAGPSYFAALLEEAGLTKWKSSKYAGFCQLCNEICGDNMLAETVKKKLRDKSLEFLLRRTAAG